MTMSKQTPSESLRANLTNSFDPAVYVRTRFGGPENYTCQQNKELFEWTSDKIHSIFTGGHYRGDTLLGIGTGPVVKDVITASQWFDEIFLTDISKDNVAFLRKWMAGDSEATEAMEYQMNLFALKEGKGTSWKVKNEQVRARVIDAIVLDMNKPEMLKGTTLNGVLVDLVITCLAVCVSSSTIDDYIKVIKNISDMLKPGGHFVILDVMDQTSYTVGDKTYSLLHTTEDEIKNAFQQNGFEIEHFETHDLGNCPKNVLSDAQTSYCVIGKNV